MIAANALLIGQIYYMLKFEDDALTRLMVGSYEYKGKLDDEPEERVHRFEVLGEDAELLLRERDLSSVVDLSGLIEELKRFQSVGNGSLDGAF